MTRRVAALIVTAATCLLPSTPASACSCVEQSPSAYLGTASAVFAGTVTAFGRTDADVDVATVAVDTVYKGEVDATARVESGSRGDTCAIGFVEGKRYLIFASSDGSRLRTALCSGTTDDVGFLDRAGVKPVATASPVAQQSAARTARSPVELPVERSRTIPIAAAWAAAVLSAGAWLARLGPLRRRP